MLYQFFVEMIGCLRHVNSQPDIRILSYVNISDVEQLTSEEDETDVILREIVTERCSDCDDVHRSALLEGPPSAVQTGVYYYYSFISNKHVKTQVSRKSFIFIGMSQGCNHRCSDCDLRGVTSCCPATSLWHLVMSLLCVRLLNSVLLITLNVTAEHSAV